MIVCRWRSSCAGNKTKLTRKPTPDRLRTARARLASPSVKTAVWRLPKTGHFFRFADECATIPSLSPIASDSRKLPMAGRMGRIFERAKRGRPASNCRAGLGGRCQGEHLPRFCIRTESLGKAIRFIRLFWFFRFFQFFRFFRRDAVQGREISRQRAAPAAGAWLPSQASESRAPVSWPPAGDLLMAAFSRR